MTHALPIPSGSRSVTPLHMQFAAPLRTAESCWFQPDEEGETGHRMGRSNRVFGAALTVAALIIGFGGGAVWYFT